MKIINSEWSWEWESTNIRELILEFEDSKISCDYNVKEKKVEVWRYYYPGKFVSYRLAEGEYSRVENELNKQLMNMNVLEDVSLW